MRRAVTLAFGVLVLASLAGLSGLRAQTVTFTSVKDNTLYEDLTGTTSNGAGQYCFTGIPGTGVRHRALVQFNTTTAIPLGSTITAAHLTMYMSRTTAPATPVVMYRTLASWGEGTSVGSMGQGGGAVATTNDATWIHRFYPNVFWTNPGGDFSQVPTASATIAGVGSYTWNSTPGLVADVQGWVNDPATNFGWTLVGDESIIGSAKRYDTHEISNSSLRPKLVVTFTPPPPAAAVAIGQACSGGGIGPFTLAASGVPSFGNASFAIQIDGGAPNATAFLFAAASTGAPVPIGPGCSVYLDLVSASSLVALGVSPIPIVLDGSGHATLFAPIPSIGSIAGASASLQAAVAIPAPPYDPLTSNALTLTIGS